MVDIVLWVVGCCLRACFSNSEYWVLDEEHVSVLTFTFLRILYFFHSIHLLFLMSFFLPWNLGVAKWSVLLTLDHEVLGQKPASAHDCKAFHLKAGACHHHPSLSWYDLFNIKRDVNTATDKRGYPHSIFLISQWKHMLGVLIRSVSLRHF